MTDARLARAQGLPRALVNIRGLPEGAQELLLASWEPRTLDAYGHWLTLLDGWLYERGQRLSVPVSESLMLSWLVELRRRKLAPSSLAVAAAAVSAVHTIAGLPSPMTLPQVRLALRGAMRELGRHRRVHDADPLLPEDLARMLAYAEQLAEEDEDHRYAREPGMLVRDRAILLLGFAGGFRRSELAGLDLRQVRRDKQGGLVVTLERRKGRYSGAKHERRIASTGSPLCPVLAVEAWRGLLSGPGPLFRAYTSRLALTERGVSGSTIDHVVRSLALAITEDQREARHYSAHSLRAGFATAAALAGKPERAIAEHLDHRSPATTARYIRSARVTTSTVTEGLGL